MFQVVNFIVLFWTFSLNLNIECSRLLGCFSRLWVLLVSKWLRVWMRAPKFGHQNRYPYPVQLRFVFSPIRRGRESTKLFLLKRGFQIFRIMWSPKQLALFALGVSAGSDNTECGAFTNYSAPGTEVRSK